MHAKALSSRSRQTPVERNSGTRSGKAALAAEMKLGGPDDLARLALKGCLIARDAAFNLRDLLPNSSGMAFFAIKDGKKELALIEGQIDERLPSAITRVGEVRARQLLSTLKSTT